MRLFPSPRAGTWAAVMAGAFVLLAALGGSLLTAQDETRSFTITAKKYAFEPAVIQVRHNDLVKITLKSEDVAHSYTIDDYRILKRATVGHAVTFEFRADKAGTFPFYCNLKSDSGCRQMRGKLVVSPR